MASTVFLWVIIAGKYTYISKKRCAYMASILSMYACLILLISVGFFLFSKFFRLDQDYGTFINNIIAHRKLIGLRSFKGEDTSYLIWNNYFNFLVFLLFGGYL